MREFMTWRALKSFGGACGESASEAAALGHADDISRRDIAGFIATVLDDGACCLHEGFSLTSMP
ncbi:hypothetical protein [Pseudorhizobium marinum]